jgi:hypothetical protein
MCSPDLKRKKKRLEIRRRMTQEEVGNWKEEEDEWMLGTCT